MDGCLISWMPDPAFVCEEGILRATDPLGRDVDFATSYAAGWTLVDIRWFNYWSRNLSSVRTCRTISSVLKEQMLIVRALAIDLTVIAFRVARTPRDSPLWPVVEALKKLERAALQFEGHNFSPDKIQISFVVGYKNRCPEFLSDSEFQRRVAGLLKEEKVRSKMKELAIFSNSGGGNKYQPQNSSSSNPNWKPGKKGFGKGKSRGGKPQKRIRNASSAVALDTSPATAVPKGRRRVINRKRRSNLIFLSFDYANAWSAVVSFSSHITCTTLRTSSSSFGRARVYFKRDSHQRPGFYHEADSQSSAKGSHG